MKDALSARLRLGDSTALEEVMDKYTAYAAKIISVYLGRTLSQEDMEEVLSDVFVKLWNSRSRMEGEVKPYLAAIARNAAKEKLRTARVTQMLPENFDLEDPAPLPEKQIETGERSAELKEAIGRMKPEERELFFRFYYLEQTVEEIAVVMGKNASTLRTQLRRGRQKLKKDLLERGMVP